MSLMTLAQELVVVDPSFEGDVSPPLSSLEPVLSPMLPAMPSHSHREHQHMHEAPNSLNILHPEKVEIEITLPDVPGAEGAPEIVVEDKEDKEDKGDTNDARKSKKEDKWDWESKGHHGFVIWVKDRVDSVPRHSGMDTAGLERAISYLQRLDNEISKAMRLDLDGALDADKVEAIRSTIDDGLQRLEDRLEKVRKTKKKKKSEAEVIPMGFVKEAQKITGVQGVYVTVPLLISRIARVCINGMVSAGHDIENTYEKQVKLYKLSVREQAEVRQLLDDMGYPLRQDRGYLPEDALEVSSSDGIDWASNYKG